MGNCIGRIYPFDDCDSCQDHCCDTCSKKLLMMGSALSKYEKRLDDEEAAREDGDTKLQENLDAETARAKEAEATLDAKIDKEIQDRIDDVNDEENRATQAEAQLRTDLNSEINRATTKENELDEAINKEVEDRKAAIAELEQTTTDNLEQVKQELQTNIDNEETRATQTEQALRNDLNTETSNRESADNTLQTNIDNEKNARIDADNDLSQRIENLEGKTTRLFYGNGTLSSPTATEIQSFIDGLEVDPPYAPPYSGIAVVVYLTDEKTYHIWHYYSNLASWKDDGIDTVTTFTNTTKGIIQGSTNEGYVSADNGLGKVNGFSELKTQVGNNYNALNTKIEAETTRAEAAEETLTTNLAAEVDRATAKETEIEASLNKEIQDRTNADAALETNIENGTIIANKATNDSDGNPINATYVKVEGFKANYLDSNNVAYKSDLDNVAKTDETNTFTQIQTFPAEGINVGSVHLTEAGLQTLETESEKIANKVDKTTTVNGHALSSNVTITKADVGLGNVVNTGDSATPVSGGITKFTTGGAYTMRQTLQNNIDSKQDKLTAGDGISISNNTISCTVSNPVTATDVVIDLQ